MAFSKRQIALLALILSSLIWGASPPIYKWSMQEIPPYTLAFLRFALASLVILPFIYKKIYIKPQDILKLLTLAAIGITLHIAFFFLGIQLTSSINVPVILAIIPLLLLGGSYVYLHEKLKPKVIVGTFLSLIGIIIIIIEPILRSRPDGSLLGNILILLSGISVVIYTLLLKKFALPYPTLTIVFWTFLLGALLFVPAFVTEAAMLHPFANLEVKSLVGILYGAIFSSAIAYFCYNFGLNYVKGSEVGIFTYLEPIVTVLVALPLLKEEITSLYILGGSIVFIGIFIAEAHLRYHHAHHLLSKKQ